MKSSSINVQALLQIWQNDLNSFTLCHLQVEFSIPQLTKITTNLKRSCQQNKGTEWQSHVESFKYEIFSICSKQSKVYL